jgi:hypothetical protein
MAPLAACSASAEAADRCSVLASPVPLLKDTETLPEGAEAGDPLLGPALLHLFPIADRRSVSATIYLDPTRTEADLARLVEDIEAQPGTVVMATLDRDETYAEFRRLFADQPKYLANVEPSDLPLSAKALVEASSAEDFEAWALERVGIYEVRILDEPSEQLERSFVSEADRERWREVAALLGRVEGDPMWASTGRELIEVSLRDGPQRAMQDDRITTTADEATRALLIDVEACPN